ncbi:MAG: Ig-like domain-containing protein, partial [Terriglobia bacterium]
GITIVQVGPHPALIASGKITDPATGFSSTIDFPAPDLQLASAVHATGLPIGKPAKGSPYAGAGYFVPHVVVRNLLSTPQTVTVTVEYPATGSATASAVAAASLPPDAVNSSAASSASVAAASGRRFLIVETGGQSPPLQLDPIAAQDGKHSPPTAQYALPTFTVAAYSTEDISLAAVMNELPLPLPFCSIRIQYSGAPGSMEADVSSVESGSNLIVDARAENEGNGWTGSGANPWHLDKGTDSVLFLTNMSDKPCPIGFEVTANGVHYYLTNLKLNAHETRAIDIRALRDAQKPDFKGNKIPAGATDGSVNWVRGDDVPVMGRLMVVSRKAGISSSYDCTPAQCALSVMGLNPTLSSPIDIGLQTQVGITASEEDCNEHQYFMGWGGQCWWTSDNPSVASVDSMGMVTGVADGTASIQVKAATIQYSCGVRAHCERSEMTKYVEAPVTVCGLSISSPSNAAVYSMGGGGYNQATVPLEATSSCSGSANWTLSFTYTTANGTSYTASPTTTTTLGQSTNYTTNVGQGGRVNAQVQATLAGHSLTQAVTFYVLGTPIPNPTVTSRLTSLYSNGATPALLTGIAMAESSYKQFNNETEMGFSGEWPYGNMANQYTSADSYVGLMQVPNNMLDGFDWNADTSDGAYVFEQKLSTASTCMQTERAAYSNLPALGGSQLEENALVFYSGNSGGGTCSSVSSNLYWVPSPDGSAWVINPSSPGYSYVQEVEGNIQ